MKNEYRQFYTDQDVHEWGVRHFGQWLNDIQPDIGNLDNGSIGNLLYFYAGNMYMIYNNFLRGLKGFDNEEIKEYSRDISILVKEISKFSLIENIIVYRYTDKKLFKYLFDSSSAELGKTFTERGFMSTTLVPGLLREFANEHNYNCLLKLYLPKGTKGAYLKFNNSKLNEHEFLLPPNATFKLVKKYFSLKYRTVYECVLINQ